MTRYDEVRYHGEVCVVEEVLDDEPDHMITVRPHGADGVFVVHESDCERL